jgi:uncharacterized protein YgiM (DUF1202 family)
MKILLLTLLIFPLFMHAGVEGTVNATKLNVRVKPDTKYAQVAQLKKGDKVVILKHIEDWYQIAAPSTSKVYVSANPKFIEKGFVKSQVHLRAGPSVAFSSYRIAETGEKLDVIDSSRKDWLQITPPFGLTAWVSAKYIYVTPENAAKLTEKPVKPDDEKKGDKKIVDKNQPADDTSSGALPFMDSKGKTVTVEGFLVALRKDSVYVTHAVASKINGEYFPLCYVHSDTHNLKLWEGRRVNITGRQRWVKGWQRPVVDLTKINPTM